MIVVVTKLVWYLLNTNQILIVQVLEMLVIFFLFPIFDFEFRFFLFVEL